MNMAKKSGIASRTFLIAAGLLASIGIQSATADETTFFGQTADGYWIAGIKFANAENNAAGFDDARVGGFVVGYEFTRPIGVDGSGSVELEVLDNIDEGNVGIASDIGVPGRWDARTLGLFFNYRTAGTVFFKGRLGFQKSDISVTSPGARTESNDGSFAYGAGLGIRLGHGDVKGLVELDWTGSGGDNDLNLIGLNGLVLF